MTDPLAPPQPGDVLTWIFFDIFMAPLLLRFLAALPAAHLEQNSRGKGPHGNQEPCTSCCHMGSLLSDEKIFSMRASRSFVFSFMGHPLGAAWGASDASEEMDATGDYGMMPLNLG